MVIRGEGKNKKIALHTKMIVEHKLKDLVSLCTQSTRTKGKKKCLCGCFSRLDLAFTKFSKRLKTSTKMSRISELGENKLQTDGTGMECGPIK